MTTDTPRVLTPEQVAEMRYAIRYGRGLAMEEKLALCDTIDALSAALSDAHFVRPAICDVCRREWTAVFPIEAERVECPSCGGFNAAPVVAFTGTTPENPNG